MASIIEFAPPTDKTEALLSYPFAVPEGSFIMDGSDVTEMPSNSQDFWNKANQELTSRGLPGMEERIPIISYGANVNPVRYAEKMSEFASDETQARLQTTPVQDAEVKGAVVWHGKQAQAGSIFAELYDGPLLPEGKTSKCKVTWMTQEQLAVMHKSEGITYNLAEVEAFVGDDQKQLTAYAYVAGRSSMLLKEGKPIEVVRPGTEAEGQGMTAKQAVAYILDNLPKQRSDDLPKSSTPEELVAEMSGQASLANKKALQVGVQRVLAEAGLSQEFAHPAPETARIGRADFNFVNHYKQLQLLEVAVSGIRTPSASNDIAVAVRSRAHAELKERLENHT